MTFEALDTLAFGLLTIMLTAFMAWQGYLDKALSSSPAVLFECPRGLPRYLRPIVSSHCYLFPTV